MRALASIALVSCAVVDGSPSGEASGSAPEARAGEQSLAAPSSSPASAAPQPSPDPAMRRGLWIWEFGKNAPPPERAAELAAAWGVHRVFVKGSNGNLGPRWWANARAENLEAFTKRGIEVWLFGYFYAPDVPDADGRTWGTIPEQVDAMMKVAGSRYVTGVVVDAEEEFKDRPKEAVSLCRALRARLDGRPLAYTSYGWLTPHKRFPFKEFDRHCGDAFLPQVYYAFGWPGGVEGSLERMRAEVHALGLEAPVWPIQSNERDPTVEKMAEFFEQAGPEASVFYLHQDGTPQTDKLGKLRFR